jgi:hypothetical protein
VQGTRRRQPPARDPATIGSEFVPCPGRLGHGLASRAVNRCRNCGTSAVLGVRLDGLDHQIEFVRTVDLPRNAIIFAQCGCVGFGEVMQSINAACRVVSHEQNGTGAIFHPREQEQVIGAEVKHAGETREREPQLPRPLAAPLRGYPPDSSGRDIATARRLTVAGGYSAGDVEPFLALRRLSPPSRKISEFSTSRSTIAVARVVLKRMLPHSEKAVLVVMSMERFWL